jgi:flagellar basal body rod protein FlgG
MVTRLSTPLSGLKDSQARIQATAHNTSNATSDAFSRQQVRSVESPGAGVRTSVDTVDLSPQGRAIAESLPSAQNNVNLVSETVNRIAAQRSFETNSRVLRTQDHLARSLLDLTA